VPFTRLAALLTLVAGCSNAAPAAAPEGSSLPEGTYRLDLGHLSRTSPEASAEVLGAASSAKLRIRVSGDGAELQSDAARPGDAPTFEVVDQGQGHVLLRARQGPDVECTRASADAIDCVMPHGITMRFRRDP